jgi:protein gp37
MRDYSRHMAAHQGERLAYFPSRQGGKSVGATARAWPLPNVWAGTSCEGQTTADERIPLLIDTPAAVRFVSAEPLLGPIDFSRWLPIAPRGDDWERVKVESAYGEPRRPAIHQIIVGGESGPEGRCMHPEWPRSIRDQCAAAGVAFHFKQWGRWAWAPDDLNFDDAVRWGRKTFWPRVKFEHHSSGRTSFDIGKKLAGRTLDGRKWDEYPPQADRFRRPPEPVTEGLL